MPWILSIIVLFLLTSCDLLKGTQGDEPTPYKIVSITKCNKFKTCLVVFSTGRQGLMTSPKVGEFGCKSMSEYTFNRCDGP